MSFKIGDKVRRKKQHYDYIWVGGIHTYRVIEIRGRSIRLSPNVQNGHIYLWLQERFDLMVQDPNEIVVL